MSPRPTTVTLSLRECEPGALPPVCAKCGAPATGETAVGFVWLPEAIALLGLLFPLLALVPMVMNVSRRTVCMPVCSRHGWVWSWGRVIFAVTLAAFVPPLVWIDSLDGGRPSVHRAIVAACVVGAWLGFSFGLRVMGRAPRPLNINESEIDLTNLHPDFVDAVENHSPERQAVYDARRADRHAGEPGA